MIISIPLAVRSRRFVDRLFTYPHRFADNVIADAEQLLKEKTISSTDEEKPVRTNVRGLTLLVTTFPNGKLFGANVKFSGMGALELLDRTIAAEAHDDNGDRIDYRKAILTTSQDKDYPVIGRFDNLNPNLRYNLGLH